MDSSTDSGPRSGRPSPPGTGRGARKEKEQFWDASVTLFAISDLDGYFRELNPAWSDMLGWSRTELKSRPYLDFVHEEDQKETAEEARRIEAGNPTREFENRYRCEDGRYRWLRWQAVADADDRRIYATARDVTDEKQRSESRARLARSVAHDLSNLLTPMSLYLAGLRARDAKGDPKTKAALDGIERSIKRAQRLLIDVTRVHDVDSGDLALETGPMDLASVLREVAHAQRNHADHWGITLKTELPDHAPVRADEGRIHQVATNLVRNALKFTPEGGQVTMRLQEYEEKWRVEVEDTGRGMAKEDQERAFHPFVQVHDEGDAHDTGSGLGLFICKGIVESHGGAIGVRSDGLGSGCTFWFELPRETQDTPSGQEE